MHLSHIVGTIVDIRMKSNNHKKPNENVMTESRTKPLSLRRFSQLCQRFCKQLFDADCVFPRVEKPSIFFFDNHSCTEREFDTSSLLAQNHICRNKRL